MEALSVTNTPEGGRYSLAYDSSPISYNNHMEGVGSRQMYLPDDANESDTPNPFLDTSFASVASSQNSQSPCSRKSTSLSSAISANDNNTVSSTNPDKNKSPSLSLSSSSTPSRLLASPQLFSVNYGSNEPDPKSETHAGRCAPGSVIDYFTISSSPTGGEETAATTPSREMALHELSEEEDEEATETHEVSSTSPMQASSTPTKPSTMIRPHLHQPPTITIRLAVSGDDETSSSSSPTEENIIWSPRPPSSVRPTPVKVLPTILEVEADETEETGSMVSDVGGAMVDPVTGHVLELACAAENDGGVSLMVGSEERYAKKEPAAVMEEVRMETEVDPIPWREVCAQFKTKEVELNEYLELEREVVKEMVDYLIEEKESLIDMMDGLKSHHTAIVSSLETKASHLDAKLEESKLVFLDHQALQKSATGFARTLEAELETLQSKHVVLQEEFAVYKQQQELEVQKLIQKFEAEKAEMLMHHEQTKQKLEVELAEAEESQKLLDSRCHQLKSRLDNRESVKGELVSRISVMERDLSEERAKCAELIKTKEGIEKESAGWREQALKYQANSERVSQQLESMTKREAILASENQGLLSQLQYLQQIQ